MRRQVARERGSPIYIRGDSGVIALVPEISVQEARMFGLRMRVLRPLAVYVIDSDGVRRIALGHVKARGVALLLVALVIAPLQYLLASRKGSRRGG